MKRLFCPLAALCLLILTAACGGRGAPPAASSAPAVLTDAEQTALFVEQKDVWYQADPEHFPAYLYYAVTDLDRDGRLEIVRSEYKYDTGASFNAFFEIGEDGRGVVELSYDLEGAEETEIAPGLVNADLPAECMYSGGVFRYRIPTPYYDNGDGLEKLYMLCADRRGAVNCELLGVKRVDAATGEVTCLDAQGAPISELEYGKAELSRYDGDGMALCSWEWVVLLDGYDFEKELTVSWEGFSFS